MHQKALQKKKKTRNIVWCGLALFFLQVFYRHIISVFARESIVRSHFLGQARGAVLQVEKSQFHPENACIKTLTGTPIIEYEKKKKDHMLSLQDTERRAQGVFSMPIQNTKKFSEDLSLPCRGTPPCWHTKMLEADDAFPFQCHNKQERIYHQALQACRYVATRKRQPSVELSHVISRNTVITHIGLFTK